MTLRKTFAMSRWRKKMRDDTIEGVEPIVGVIEAIGRQMIAETELKARIEMISVVEASAFAHDIIGAELARQSIETTRSRADQNAEAARRDEIARSVERSRVASASARGAPAPYAPPIDA